MLVGEKSTRTDPLWLRAVLSVVLSGVFWLITYLFLADLLGPVSLYLCAGLAIVTAVLMAWKGRRVGSIATWFVELLSGI